LKEINTGRFLLKANLVLSKNTKIFLKLAGNTFTALSVVRGQEEVVNDTKE
jgi:hypothetical protein